MRFQQHRVNVQRPCRSARRDWFGFILMGWFDRCCITLKALPIFPVTFCSRRTDRGKLPPPSPLLSTWRTLSALTHVDTRNISNALHFSKMQASTTPQYLSLCLRVETQTAKLHSHLCALMLRFFTQAFSHLWLTLFTFLSSVWGRDSQRGELPAEIFPQTEKPHSGWDLYWARWLPSGFTKWTRGVETALR